MITFRRSVLTFRAPLQNPSKGEKKGVLGLLLGVALVMIWFPSLRYFPPDVPASIVCIVPMALILIGTVGAKVWWQAMAWPGFRAVVLGGLLLFVWSLFSATWSVVPLRVFRVSYAHASGLTLMLAIAFYCQNAVRARQLFLHFTAAASIIGVILLLLKWVPGLDQVIPVLGGDPAVGEFLGGSDRYSGFFKGPNQYGIASAAILGPVFAAALSKMPNRRVTCRIILWLGVIATLGGVILSGSKANTLLAFVVSCLVLLRVVLLSRNVSKLMIRLVGASLGLFIIAMIGSLVLQYLNPRAYQLLETAFVDDAMAVSSMQVRDAIWTESIEAGLQAPLQGTGAGSRVLGYSHSHNVALDYFRSMGIPGTLALAILLGGIFRAGACGYWRAGRFGKNEGLLSAMAFGSAVGAGTYVLSNMSSDSFGPVTILFLYSNLGFLFVALNLLHQIQRAKRKPKVISMARRRVETLPTIA